MRGFPAECKWLPSKISAFRFMPARAPYAPDAPWPGTGRFDDGSRLTLYLAHSAAGAVAEFLRRRPDLIPFQDSLAIEVFEIQLSVVTEMLDVRSRDQAVLAQIEWGRLVANDLDEDRRYRECRLLASDVEQAGLQGVAYPSAALPSSAWNLVLFGPGGEDAWVSAGAASVRAPKVDPVQLVAVPSPA